MTTVDDTFEQLTLVSVQTLKSSKNLKLNQMILAVTWAEIYAIAGKKGGLRYSPDYGGPAVININYSMSLYFKPTSQR